MISGLTFACVPHCVCVCVCGDGHCETSIGNG